MFCLNANRLIIDECLEFCRTRRVDCSTGWNLTLIDFDWFNTEYKYDRTSFKGDGSKIGFVNIDQKYVDMTFKLSAGTKQKFFEGLTELKRVMQPPKTYSGVFGNDEQYVPITWQDPNRQEWFSRGKLVSMRKRSQTNDWCCATFNARFILGGWGRWLLNQKPPCTYSGCWIGKSSQFQGISNATSGVSTFPPVLTDDTYMSLAESNWVNYCQGLFTPQPFFNNYQAFDYPGPSCCKTTFKITALTDLTGPIQLMVMWWDCSFQGMKINNDFTINQGACINISSETGTISVVDPWSPVPFIDLYDNLSDVYCATPIICSHKEIDIPSLWLSGVNNIVAFTVGSGSAELSFDCKNTWC